MLLCAWCAVMTTTALAQGQHLGRQWADVEGGYASTHIVVQVTPNFAQAAERAHLTRGGQFVSAARAVMSAKLDAACRRWGVHDIRPVFDFEFQHPELAAKYELDRFYTIEVAQGTDAPAMAAEFGTYGGEIAVATVDTIGGISNVFPDDPDFDLQWGMHNDGSGPGCVADADINAPEAWKIETGEIADPVIIAIIDSGVEPHAEFVDRMVPGYNTADADPTATDDDCFVYHGTHVAGIAAAGGNDALGVAGVCWGCKIMPIDVLIDAAPYSGCNGIVTDLSEGITWAADHGADVINMSLQYCYLDAIQQVILKRAVDYAEDLGVTIVAAAGNNSYCGIGQIAWPAKFATTMAVGGITCDGTVATTASGPEIDVAAPGDRIWSCGFADGYQYLDGTSMATPHVSGLAALIKSRVPEIPNTAIIQLIKDTAVDIETEGWDNRSGYGLINAYQALLEAPDYPRIVSSYPPSGSIDARRPTDPDNADVHYGWDSVELTFSRPMPAMTARDFVIEETGTNVPPAISYIQFIDDYTRRVVLVRPIDPVEWTSVIHVTSQTRVDLGFMPGDVNGDTITVAADILELIDVLNGVGTASDIWSLDLDRSGETNAADVLEVIDLLNGAGVYEPYNNVRLPVIVP